MVYTLLKHLLDLFDAGNYVIPLAWFDSPTLKILLTKMCSRKYLKKTLQTPFEAKNKKKKKLPNSGAFLLLQYFDLQNYVISEVFLKLLNVK